MISTIASALPIIKAFIPFLNGTDTFQGVILMLLILAIGFKLTGMYLVLKETQINKMSVEHFDKRNTRQIKWILLVILALSVLKALTEVL